MKQIIILILISIILVSCSKTTTIAENSNWYLEEKTNIFGKPTEHTIHQIFNIYNKIDIRVYATKEDTATFFMDLSNILNDIIDNEIELTFDNTPTFRLKSEFYSLVWAGDESEQLISKFKKHNKVKVQGVGCKEYEIINLEGFKEIYNTYLLRVNFPKIKLNR